MNAVRRLLFCLLSLPVAALAEDEAARPQNPLASIDKDSLKAFVERPLFEPTRRPPAAAPPPVEPPPPPPRVEAPPMLRLIGVIQGADSLAAVVLHLDTGRTETLHAGDRLGGWRVEVLPDALRVSSGDRAFDYAMFRGNLRQGPIAVGSGATATGQP